MELYTVQKYKKDAKINAINYLSTYSSIILIIFLKTKINKTAKMACPIWCLYAITI